MRIDTERGKPVSYAFVNDRATLLYLVNQGTLTFHVWASRVADLDRPDFVLFDLDPGPAPVTDVVAVARAVKAALDAEGVAAAVKTSRRSAAAGCTSMCCRTPAGTTPSRPTSADCIRRRKSLPRRPA